MQFGRSRFSRGCHLIGALWFCSFESRTWARRLAQSPELDFGFLFFLFLGMVLFFALRFYAAAATVIRLLLCNGS